MIEEAARCGDQHIHTLVEGGVLVGKAYTTDQQRHGQLVIGAEFLEGVGHLCGQFAGRGEDQRAWQARLGAAGCQNFDHRQSEGGGLACACLRRAQDIAPHQHIGNRFLLDGGGGGVAQIGDRLAQFIAQAEFRKIHQLRPLQR